LLQQEVSKPLPRRNNRAWSYREFFKGILIIGGFSPQIPRFIRLGFGPGLTTP
jgi:hypothetical protein